MEQLVKFNVDGSVTLSAVAAKSVMAYLINSGADEHEAAGLSEIDAEVCLTVAGVVADAGEAAAKLRAHGVESTAGISADWKH